MLWEFLLIYPRNLIPQTISYFTSQNVWKLRGLPLKLLQSYLSNRKQCVYCNEKYYSVKQIEKGVPQGSLLGPILFLIYINDIVNASSVLDYTIQADDTTLSLKDKIINTLHETLTSELNKINLWIQSNKLKLNLKKLIFIFFQNRSIKHMFPSVFLNGESIT